MSRFLKGMCLAILVLVLLSTTVFAADNLSYNGYNYDAYGTSTPAPEGYEPILQFSGSELPCGAFNSPQDIFAADDGKIYIADTGNNRIVVLDSEFKFLRTIDTIEINGTAEQLLAPNGIFVKNDNIYIVQTEKQRVLRCDLNGKVLKQFLRPVSDIFSDEMTYSPTKVLVNNSGTVYVLVKNFVYGALTYSPEGDFLNYYGSNKVTASLEVLMDYFWKQLLTTEQVNQMKRYVPIEYTNFCIDNENFIYTVTKGSRVNQVRRLNTLGQNVLMEYERNISGHTGMFGDIERSKLGGVWTANAFVDIAVDDDGFINILDQNNGRIFQFDPESRLMHIFGGNADVGYGFAQAVSLECIGNKIAVLDANKNSITVFAPTEYGSLVKNAVLLYNDGFYSKAKTQWEKVIERNQNFELAYHGLGKAEFEEGNYKQAMQYYKLAYSRDGYSDAFKEYRAVILRKTLPYIGTVIVIAVLIFLLVGKKIKLKTGFSQSKAMQVLFYPSDTLFEMKYHKQFKSKTVFLVLLFMFTSLICTRQLTAFTFNHNNVNEGNMLVVLFALLYVFIAFCTVNWCITSLLDGKGKFKEIACSTCYALIPYICSSYIAVVLSYFLTADEGMFITIVTSVGLIWSVVLLISAFKTIHEYSFSKTIASILITVLGVVALIFLCVLMVGLLQQIVSFFTTIYNEIMYR